ncbi:MAG: DUF1456 family protein [Thermodesulfovibrionales bacterium]
MAVTKNDILVRVRYALNIDDSTMLEIFRLSGDEIDKAGLLNLLKKENEEGYVDCSDKVLGYFLDGLIFHKRGRQEMKQGQERKPAPRLSNNTILKKLRIALELKEDNMIGILKLAGSDVSKSELTALFRKEGHRNYKECGDQFLRNFLKGLTLRYRTGS